MQYDTSQMVVFFLCFTVLIFVLIETGHRVGVWRRRKRGHESEPTVGQSVSAALGLLGFMLAFTFGMAESNYQARIQAMAEEANAVGTACLRADLIPEPHRTAARRLYAEYVDVRLKALEPGQLAWGLKQSEELHRKLWATAAAAAATDPHSVAIGKFIDTTNEVIDIHAVRTRLGIYKRVPVTIWICLLAMSTMAMALIGYYGGMMGKSRSLATAPMVLCFIAVLWLIADLDSPVGGFLRNSQRQMIELQEQIKANRP